MSSLHANITVRRPSATRWVVEADIIGRAGLIEGIIMQVMSGGEGNQLPAELVAVFPGLELLYGQAAQAIRREAEGRVSITNLDDVWALKSSKEIEATVSLAISEDCRAFFVV